MKTIILAGIFTISVISPVFADGKLKAVKELTAMRDYDTLINQAKSMYAVECH